jgi:hypothetical protein
MGTATIRQKTSERLYSTSKAHLELTFDEKKGLVGFVP